jgi:hypothetical protein
MFNRVKIFLVIGFLFWGLADAIARDAAKRYEEIVLPPIKIANPFKTAVADTNLQPPQKMTVGVEAKKAGVPDDDSIKVVQRKDDPKVQSGTGLTESIVPSVEMLIDTMQPVSNTKQPKAGMKGKKNP